MKFLWGVATSGHQIEGMNLHNDWWAWEQSGQTESGERSGRACDHWNRWEQDLDLAASLGINSYRFSIEWSRIEPREGEWDPSALEWYSNLIAGCERRGLLPMVTLLHFTLPQWLADKGGLVHPHFAERFAGYVRRVAQAFGDRVPLWCTVNEPMLLVIGSYLAGVFPPGKTDPSLAARAHAGLLRAHVAAYDTLKAVITRRSGPFQEYPLGVGLAHNMVRFVVENPWDLRQHFLRLGFDRYYNRAWLRAVTGRRQCFGLPAFLPAPAQVWTARGRRTADFIGVNYYTRVYPCWGPQAHPTEFAEFRRWPIGLRYALSSDTTTDLGWSIDASGLAYVLQLAAATRLPLFVTENGLADASDTKRPDFLTQHLRVLDEMREKHIDIRGYYHWSLIDNFEWTKGFGPRFGLFAVDYSTMQRTARVSADIYRDAINARSRTPSPL